MPPPLPPVFVLQQPSGPAAAPPTGHVIAPISGAPAPARPVVAIGRPPREPPPQTAPQALHDEHTARTAGLPTGFEWDADGRGAHPIRGTPMDPSYGQNTVDPASVTDAERRVAQAMITGRVAPPTGRNLATPQTMRLLAVASQIDPEFDLTIWQRRNAASRAYTSGPQGQNITAFNTAIHHIARYALGSDALDNWGGENTPAALSHVSNSLRNAMASGDLAARLVTFKNNADAVASELTRAFRGTNGAEADVQAWRQNLQPNMTPQEFHASVQSAIDLLRGRIEAMNSSYRQAMGPNATVEDLIDPHSREILHNLENGTLGDPGSTPPAPDPHRGDIGAAIPGLLMPGVGPGTPPNGSPPTGGGAPPNAPPDHSGDAVVATGWNGARNLPPPPPDIHALPGGAEFAGALQTAIRSGRFHNVDEAMQFAQTLNAQYAQMLNRGDLAAAVRNPRSAGVMVPHNIPPPPPPPPDISGARGDSPEAMRRNIQENNLVAGLPVIGPPVAAWQSLRGPEAGNAFLHGAQDWALLGGRDEMNAVGDAITGRSYDESLAQQQAMDDYDSQNHFWDRLGGQVATGLPEAFLPGSLAAQMGRNGAQGLAYGFGSGRNGFQDRASNALISGGIGAATPLAFNLAGRAVNALRGAPSELEQAAVRQQVPLTRLETGGTGTRMAAGVVGMTPGEIPLVQGTQRSIAGSEAARTRIAGTIGLARDETGAGSAAQRGIRDFRATSADRRTQLFNRVPIPAERPAATMATADALRARTAGMESNQPLSEMFRDKRLEGYLDAIEGREAQVPTGVLDAQGNPLTRTVQQGGGLSYGDMRRFRSLVGEMIEQPNVAGESSSKAALRALYGGLSQDLETTAQQTSPRALTMMRRAIQYDRGRHARLDGLVTDILGRENNENPLAAFEQINRWAQAKGGDPARLGQALRSMPADEANSVRASVFARMGQASAGKQDATGDVFSPAEFSTQWNKLSERARGVLIPNAGHRADLNDLVQITTAQKRSSQYANFSRTTLGANAIAFIEALHAAPISALVGATGSYAAGRFLASPVGARWLSRMATTRNPSLLIQGLSTVAARDPAIAQQALGLRQTLLNAVNDNTVSRAAASPDEGQRNE